MEVVVVHGGAWDVPEPLWEASLEGVKAAARRGHQVLRGGGSVVEAVEAAVVVLEDNPAFDAGTGSVLTLDGEVEMDALVMSGARLRAGAVAAIRSVANPVKVARLVLEKTPHVMLAGSGANQFAAAHGHPQVPPHTLVTPHARREWETFKKFSKSVDSLFNVLHVQQQRSGHDTVGCAALDSLGHTAAATSTGGITAKMPGRVGDTPVPGAGGYADDQVGAVSTTGHGEAILRVCLARHITATMATGVPVSASIESSLEHMAQRVAGCGGAVAVSREGEVGMAFSTPRMPWAYVKHRRLHYGIHPGQHVEEDL
ncbi:Isoaspartyl peptidase/L-asparaginase [Chionoecetes opilio]|uniref:Isoaspartyl peptidase/L-asparaginase n=1 Tax=Chionoecetes opilio TaxID=41210 RepID=A0A8J4Y8J4_CHIOP|nr:Isoaspartyl peptidase/L-asparaginase [Chionoecetes opilio]